MDGRRDKLGTEMTTKIILGDGIELTKAFSDNSVDGIVTDPPYPDYYVSEYGYFEGMLDFLKDFNCRQLVFWSAKAPFPLDYSAIHIWDKLMGVGSMYERIFERNGGKAYRVFRGCPIQNNVCAEMSSDIFTGHKSQKPIHLMRELIEKYTKPGYTVLDPFMGSGSTGVACLQTGRSFIGIEKDPIFFEIAKK
jgi:DNA modification methylase